MQLVENSFEAIDCEVSVAVAGTAWFKLRKIRAQGTVMCVFERCAYVEFDTQLVCIGLRELGGSAINALLSESYKTLPYALQPGAPVRFSNAGFYVDDKEQGEQRNSTLFNMATTGRYEPPNRNWRSLYNAGKFADDFIHSLGCPNEGLAPLLTQSFEHEFADQHLLNYLRPAIKLLFAQILNSDQHSAETAASTAFNVLAFKKLLGAGPGLTPSGDDFLTGIFSALYVMNREQIAVQLWDSLHTTARQATTPVSFALLEQVALGMFGEQIDELLETVLTYPQTDGRSISLKLSKIGHTSGWDWFTGFVLCMRLLEPE